MPARPGRPFGPDDIALTLLAMDDGVPRRILSAIGVSAPRLGDEIRRRRQRDR